MLEDRESPTPPAARVLLIERDGTALASLSAGAAECFAVGPHVEIAAGGKAGAELLRHNEWDLVAADLATLCETVAEPAEAIARLAKFAGTAITIVLAADSSVSAAVAAMRAGAHDYIPKPVQPAGFGTRVAALMARHGKGFALRSRLEAPPALPYPALSLAANRDEAESSGSGRRPAVLPMWQQEQRIIEHAIQSFSGNVALAAAALQLSPSTIYRKRQAWADAASGKQGAA
jgi:DNA-binding NtrC family response regulator